LAVLRDTLTALDEILALPPGLLAGDVTRRFASEVGRRIAPRNLAGLSDPSRNRLYPVDLAPLLAGASLLGLSAEDLRQKIDRLRGEANLA